MLIYKRGLIFDKDRKITLFSEYLYSDADTNVILDEFPPVLQFAYQ